MYLYQIILMWLSLNKCLLVLSQRLKKKYQFKNFIKIHDVCKIICISYHGIQLSMRLCPIVFILKVKTKIWKKINTTLIPVGLITSFLVRCVI